MNNLAIHRIERTALLHCVRHRGRELQHAPSAGMVEGDAIKALVAPPKALSAPRNPLALLTRHSSFRR